MTELERLNNSTLDDYFFTVLNRLVDFSSIPVEEQPYTQDSDEELSLYERLIIHSSLEKPTLQEMEGEFLVLKAELISAEEVSLVEIARIQDLKDRWQTLLDLNIGYSFCPPSTSEYINAPTYYSKIIMGNSDKDDAESELSGCESRAQTLKTTSDSLNGRESKKLLGRKARLLCQDILDLVAGYNQARSLTTEQIDEMKTTFATAKTYLQDGQPWGAKIAIDAITPDDVLVTQEMYDSIMLEFSSSGLAGL